MGTTKGTKGDRTLLTRPPIIWPLSLADLATRWQITELEAARRVRKFDIPAFNIGSPTEPEWRWRLSTVEVWEAQNERSMEEKTEADIPVKAAAPVAWDGISRTGRVGKGKGRGDAKSSRRLS